MPEEMLSMDEIFLKRLTETVEAHLNDRTFGVDELASEMSLSHSQLHRKLQTITGQSASRFIRTIKLRKAREMLERRVARVSEISDQLVLAALPISVRCLPRNLVFHQGKSDR